ncbi:MAG: 4a-hydroxytetrahydrobiopterin dehydratase [Flavobacteriales bacterium]|nr:4a-hydroxytetrahydrobiopterin dehydratase [Flavobacteriales bacterium]|tara:strand:+ start:522 stop:848 length:327 start_codon:yes stop_codon:yes gene_type:complete
MSLNKKTCVPCQGGIPPLNAKEINVLIKQLNGWYVENNKKLKKEYEFSTYVDAINFVNSVAKLAEDEQHHPYIHINFKKILVIMFTHKIDGLHENDFIMASKCDNIKK